MQRGLLMWLSIPVGLLASGAHAYSQAEAKAHAEVSARSAVIYVARRGWHIDIGFAAADLQPPLSSVAAEFPGVQYLFFGFGDQQYLLSNKHNAPVLLAALWPGRAMLLTTGLAASPQQAFVEGHIAVLAVTPRQLQDAQAFVWQSLDQKSTVKPYARGPYDGSLYFAAAPRYSAVHTCNTWAAETLKAAGLPVRSGGVLFAGQLWVQVRRIMREQPALSRTGQVQGGLEPSWQITVVPEP